MKWMDFSNTKIRSNRSLFDYAKVQKLISEIIRNKKIFIDNNIYEKDYLDVGCGPNTHEEFINLDYEWRPEIDICWDVTEGIPLPSESMKGIFTEHCLEHIRFKDLDDVIGELFRVLEYGGVLRIVVPDGELYLKEYDKIINGESGAIPYRKRDTYKGMYSPI